MGPQRFTVDKTGAGCRVDLHLARRYPDHSRRFFQRLIAAGEVRVAGRAVDPDRRLQAGEEVFLFIPEPTPGPPLPEDIPLEIIHEDPDLIAVNKPAGLVVHPGAGHRGDTLVNALLFRGGGLSGINGPDRPGIVHRLDRDTSGLLLVARHDVAHHRLARQFAERLVEKTYLAVVEGAPRLDGDRIDLPLGKVRFNRMGVKRRGGKAARTDYRVLARGQRFSLLELKPHTGRTHQLRVHLAAIGHPVAADAEYGRRELVTRLDLPAGGPDEVLLDRQALHARRLAFNHPRDDRRLELTAPLPADLAGLIAALGWPAPG